VRALAPNSLPSEPVKDLSAEAFNAAVDDCLERNADLLLFTKLLDWSGEQEFRFVAIRHDDYGGSLDVGFGDALRAVAVGVRCIWHERRPKIVRDVRGFGERIRARRAASRPSGYVVDALARTGEGLNPLTIR
jgi:hypothetical protein